MQSVISHPSAYIDLKKHELINQKFSQINVENQLIITALGTVISQTGEATLKMRNCHILTGTHNM